MCDAALSRKKHQNIYQNKVVHEKYAKLYLTSFYATLHHIKVIAQYELLYPVRTERTDKGMIKERRKVSG
jgi:uncharacterized membrane protein